MAKVLRSETVNRMCLRCAASIPETKYPKGGQWICADCTMVQPAMPFITRMGRELFDTRQVFAGYRVKKVIQGDTVYQREEVLPCRIGEFFAVAENVVGFQSRSTRAANIVLEEFGGVRCVTRSDNGECVLHVPVSLFSQVAARVGARRKRVMSEEQRAAASERLRKHRQEAVR